MKNNKLRVIWIIPNLCCYLVSMGISYFILTNIKELKNIDRLEIWIIMLLLLLVVSVFGSYQIFTWIKEEEM